MADVNQLIALIEANRERAVNFGGSEDAPSQEWIEKAEKRLGRCFPPSYKWFLQNYGGGEIRGEEVFSIYGMEFESVFGGDVVFQYLAHQRSKTLNPDEVPLSQNDFGDIFFWKTSSVDDNGEYPIFVKRGSDNELFASTFAEFLEKRIRGLSN